jgi:hypothetical protein
MAARLPADHEAAELSLAVVVVRVSVVVGTLTGPLGRLSAARLTVVPQYPDRVRTFLKLFASATRTFVGSGAS